MNAFVKGGVRRNKNIKIKFFLQLKNIRAQQLFSLPQKLKAGDSDDPLSTT